MRSNLLKGAVLTSLAFSGLAVAQGTTGTASTSSSNLSSFWSNLEESPLSLSLDVDSSIQPVEGEVREVSTAITPTLGYKLGSKTSISASNRWLSTIKEDNTDEFISYDAWVYGSQKLAPESKYGVSLKGSLLGTVYQQASTRSAGNDGYMKVGLSLGKTLTDKISLSGEIAHYEYVQNEMAKAGTSERYGRLKVGMSAAITDKINFSLPAYTYLGTEKQDADRSAMSVRILPSLSFSYIPKTTIITYIDTTIMREHDGSAMVRNLQDKTYYGFELYFSVF